MTTIMRHLDDFIDKTTMYRLVLYYLGGLLAAAFVLGFFKLVPPDPTAIAFSTVLILGSCWVGNWVFTTVFRTPANTESVYITALIIALIMTPVTATDLVGVGGLISASVWAIAAKFILAIGKKHIFNPAAVGVALTALLLNQPATWWVGGPLTLLPLVLLGGLFIGRKLQRFDMIGAFIAVNLVIVAVTAPAGGLLNSISETVLHSSIFFLAFAMLTEPLTAPQARWPRIAYGALVGGLAAPSIHIGGYYLTPEVALLVGNVFAYVVSPKGRFALTLVRIEQAANGAYDFVFKSDRKVNFQPGQYLEWTLGVKHADNRGNRRSFTIASAPTEEDVRLGVKFYPEASAFKRALAAMRPGDEIYASQLAGSFVLPKNPDTKLAFIAGGIGITPFRSMLQYLIDRKEKREVVVLYGNAKVKDIAYGDVLERAESELGIRTVYAVAAEPTPVQGTHAGFIDAELIRRQVPDFKERTFFLSGPHVMVDNFKRTLREMGVPRSRIKTDFFPGLA
jgi:ferredoxin-NADP reductase